MVKSKQKISEQRTEQMFAIIQEWEESDLNQKAFYTQRGIKPHIFWYWLRRYRARVQPEKKSTKGFIAVEVEQAAESAVLAEIIYRDGTRLVFKERVGVQVLQSLLPKVV